MIYREFLPDIWSRALGDILLEGSFPIPNLYVLAGHNGSAPRPRRFQGTLTKPATHARFNTFTRVHDALQEADHSPRK